MKVLFIVKANAISGAGHFFRTFELARQLYLNERAIHYLFEDDVDQLIKEQIQQSPFTYETFHSNNAVDEIVLGQQFTDDQLEWVVIDHPNLSKDIEDKLKTHGVRLVIFDDEVHYRNCDILVNANFGINSRDYEKFENQNTQYLLGTDYIALRPEFLEFNRGKKIQMDGPLNLHMYFGSSHLADECLHYANWILDAFSNININLIYNNPDKLESLLGNKRTSEEGRLICYPYTESMATLINQCDIGFGAPGVTTWERAYLGLPTCYISYNHVQDSILRKLAQDGYCEYMGHYNAIPKTAFHDKFSCFLQDKVKLKAISDASYRLIDGKGALRICNRMIQDVT